MNKLNSQDYPNTAHAAVFMAILACAALSTSRTGAQALLNEGFESYAVGTFPTSGGWIFRNLGSGGDPAAQQVDNTVSALGTKSLRIVGAVGGNVAAYHPLLNLPHRFRLETSALIRQFPSGGSEGFAGAVGAVFVSDPAGNGGSAHGAVAFFNNGWLCAMFNSSLTDRLQLVPFTTNTWYRIEMTIDLDQGRFDVDIDGLRRATSLTVPTNALPNGIEFLSGIGANAAAWYDDVAVYVPTNAAWLQIYPAVELLLQTELYKSYQLQYARDVDATNWYNLGAPFVGTGNPQSLFQPTRDTPRRFYRVQDLGAITP